MREYKCTHCSKIFGNMHEKMPDHLWAICPWCGWPNDIGTKRAHTIKMPKEYHLIAKKITRNEEMKKERKQNVVNRSTNTKSDKATSGTGRPRGRPKGSGKKEIVDAVPPKRGRGRPSRVETIERLKASVK
jgi:phage FluMu protein Com